jgi:hypothetical protein
MTDTTDPKITDKPEARCHDCDRNVTHYNVWLDADGAERISCWQCTARDEKGFNAKRDFHRSSRRGVIPR